MGLADVIVEFGVTSLNLDSLIVVVVVVLGSVMIGVRSFWSDHECDFYFDLFFLVAISMVYFLTNRDMAKVVETEEFVGLVNPSILEENWFSVLLQTNLRSYLDTQVSPFASSMLFLKRLKIYCL